MNLSDGGEWIFVNTKWAFFSAILWREQDTFWKDDDDVCFVLEKHVPDSAPINLCTYSLMLHAAWRGKKILILYSSGLTWLGSLAKYGTMKLVLRVLPFYRQNEHFKDRISLRVDFIIYEIHNFKFFITSAFTVQLQKVINMTFYKINLTNYRNSQRHNVSSQINLTNYRNSQH